MAGGLAGGTYATPVQSQAQRIEQDRRSARSRNAARVEQSERHSQAVSRAAAPGPSTVRNVTRRADGSDVMDVSSWDPRSRQYRTNYSQVGPSSIDQLRKLRRLFGSSWGSTSGVEAGPPQPLPEHVTGSTPASSAAAEAAEFGRAKDRVGKITRGAMTALADTMSARGLGGSGIEGDKIGDLTVSGAGQLGEVARDQSIRALQRAAQIEDRNYAGDVGQRGQDIGYAGSLNDYQIRQAELRRAQEWQQQQLLQSLAGLVF